MFTIIQVSESLTRISDIKRQRCSVLALSNMGGAVSVFRSDPEVVFKIEDFLWNAIEQVWHLPKGQSVSTRQPFQSTMPLLSKPIKGCLHTIEPCKHSQSLGEKDDKEDKTPLESTSCCHLSATSQHTAHYWLFCVAVIASRLRHHSDKMCIEINCRWVATCS